MLGTAPFWSFELEVGPEVLIPRPATGEAVRRALAHLPAFWRGRYEGPGIVDVLVDAVDIEVTPAMPYQEGGDAMGWRETVSFRLTPGIVQLVRFI